MFILYCFLNDDMVVSPTETGIFEEELVYVQKDDLYVVAGRVEKLYPKNETNLIKYNEKLEKWYKQCTLLPISYGIALDSLQDIEQLLLKYYQEIMTQLIKIEGMNEWSLYLVNSTEKPKLKRDSKTGKGYMMELFSKYAQREEQIKKMDVIQECLDMEVVDKVDEFIDHKDFLCRHLLINQALSDQFCEKFTQYQENNPELSIILTGPWIPFNFVKLELSLRRDDNDTR